MFETLTERLGQAMKHLRGHGSLTEENMAESLKEVRTALLSADVHFKVARQFIERVKEACVGQEVLKSVEPGQQVVKIISDELVKLLGEGTTELKEKRPLKVMLVGLHGSGKTTCTAKLAHFLSKKDLIPHLVACDVYRPAAIDQLETLAGQNKFRFYANRETKDVPKIGKEGLKAAQKEGSNLILFDTAGRLQIDENLIEEVKRLRKTIEPDEVLLVADAALGQEAVNVAKHFHEAVELSGIILTKLDGDARGGAALSMKQITGVPIKFVGTGEKVEDFDRFHPDRMAQRILGMGDVVSLVERAQETMDEKEAERMAEKMRRADFNFADMLQQFRQVKKMGNLGSLMGMMPGMSGVKIGDQEEKKMARTEAIILSMTTAEREQPNLMNGSRRMRIASGAGVRVSDVNQLIKQHGQMRKMMKMMKGGKGRRMMEQMKQSGMMGGKGAGRGMPKLPGMGG